MFNRKRWKSPEVLSVPNPNPDYKPPMGSACDNIKQQSECSILAELRDVQNSIKKLEQRKRDLEHQYFPMIYWVMAAMLEIPKHIPSYLHRNSDEFVDRETIEMALNGLRCHLNEKNINSEKFNVDKFCAEVRDYIHNNEAIESTNNELKKMIERQSQLKESLRIK